MSFTELASDYPALLAVAIFVARILDVSLGTVRTIVVFRGRRLLAALIGFVEIIIWVLAAGQVLQNLEMVSAISYRADGELAKILRERGFRAIDVDADMGRGPPVDLVLTVTRRRRVPELIRTILEADPEAQYSVTDVKFAHEGFDPTMLRPTGWGWSSLTKRK